MINATNSEQKVQINWSIPYHPIHFTIYAIVSLPTSLVILNYSKKNLNFVYLLVVFFLNFICKYFLLILHSQHFTMIPAFGTAKNPSTSREERLGSIHRKRSCQPTGTHPSPRSASVWKPVSRWSLLSCISRPAPYILLLLTGNTAPPHWAVTCGSLFLDLKALCNISVTGRGSTLCVRLRLIHPKQESV